LGDLLIDGVGSVVTEAAAVGVGLLSSAVLTPAAYLPVRFFTEFYLSLVWESAVNRYDWRQMLSKQLTPLPSPTIQHPPAIIAPIAPNPLPVSETNTLTPVHNTATETPSPLSTPTRTQDIEILPTQTPSPPSNQ
jgi:hypothetical protein